MAKQYAVIVELPSHKAEHDRSEWEVWETTNDSVGKNFIQPYPPEMSYTEVAEAVKNYIGQNYYAIETREESERRLEQRGRTEPEQMDYSLEIERDQTKEIAYTQEEIERNEAEDAAEIRTTLDTIMKEFAEKELEEKKRRLPQEIVATNESSELKSETSKTEEEKVQAKEPEKREPDRSFPDGIHHGFYILADHRGDQHVYADSQGKREVFQETPDKLRTKTNEVHAVKLMLDTVAHRGWSSITVKGSQEFRREAWLEGQARGIAVTGYKPTELDLQELKNREQAYLRNEIVQTEDRPITRDGAQFSPVATDRVTGDLQVDKNGATLRENEQGAPNEHTRADRRSTDYKDGIQGVFVEQGSRPYKDNSRNDPSPYIVLQDDQGERHTAWGVGLPDAMLKAGARQGDYVHVREAGMESVTKNVLHEVNGRTVRVPQQVERRAWDADVLKANEAERQQVSLDEEARQSTDSRTTKESSANRDVSRSVSSGERSLQVGPARDVALEDGIYANEARAKEYMATGRSAAGYIPELKSAAALESYVERKIRQKFPNDPVVVQRAMHTARAKIGHAVARGHDFPQPHVVATKDIAKAQQKSAKDAQQNSLDTNTQISTAILSENKEINKDHDR